MKSLVIEDDFISRKLFQKILMDFGECKVSTECKEAIELFKVAIESNMPYDLICIDMMVSEINGEECYRVIRNIEDEKCINDERRVKVIFTTTENNIKSDKKFKGENKAFIIKPIEKDKIINELKRFGLIT